MQKWLSFVVVAVLSSAIFAQDGVPAKLGWQKSTNGYVWVGSHYWGGIANAEFDSRQVMQGAFNVLLQKGNTSITLKTWYSLSPQKGADGKRWTGNAQEFDLGVEVSRLLADGWQLKAGYSHFFITKSAGSDVEMLVFVVSKDVRLTEHNSITGSFEFYQFFPTFSNGPAAGQFYLPSVALTCSMGKWIVNTSIAGAFNSNGVFGLKSEPAVRITAQVLYKLPKGSTGPDVTYGGVPGSKERPVRLIVGWTWNF